MTALIKCRCCNGTGAQPLEQAYQETLDRVTKKWQGTKKIHALVASKWAKQPTCTNNRLTELRRLGLVVSEKRGKPLYWRLA